MGGKKQFPLYSDLKMLPPEQHTNCPELAGATSELWVKTLSLTMEKKILLEGRKIL